MEYKAIFNVIKKRRIRMFFRRVLATVLIIALVFGCYSPGTKPQIYADETGDLMGNQASAKPFMDAPSSKPDFPSLTSTDWMSGLDNGRYLSEVNIPGAHDACTQHMLQAMSELKAIGQPYAECQDMQYQDMLNNGVRILDLRLNNWYLEDLALPAWAEILLAIFGFAVWVVERIVEWIIEQTDANKEDDGKNCYIVHGDNSWGRTYWASKDGSDNYITFNNVLDTCKSFLNSHPSETIILYLADETTDSTQTGPIQARAKGILQAFSSEINPSTGKPYLYMEDGEFKTYTKMPTVGDVRGKVVIASNSPSDFGVGMSKNSSIGYKPGDTLTYNEENHYEVGAGDKWNYLSNFFNDKVGETIPSNLFFHLDHMNNIYTSSNVVFSESPRDIAKDINPKVYTGSNALIQGTGTYYGWVLSDVVSSTTAEPVWKSNFPSDLEYCTVTVKTGDTGGAFTSPDQTYVVLEGRKFSFPGDIYDELHGSEISFAGWNVGKKTYSKDNTYIVMGDVTITASWDEQVEVPITVTWDDSDNNDGIRPSEVQMDLARDDGKFQYNPCVNEKMGWKTTESVYVPVGKKATDVYRMNMVYNEVITGRDTTTTYADNISIAPEGGYNVALKHTKNLYTVDASVEWQDEDDKDGARPYSVTAHLKDGGETVASKDVSLKDSNPQNPDIWKISFEGIPLKRANGEMITYTLDCEWNDLYSLYTKQGAEGKATDYFNVINTHTPDMVSPGCTVLWNDGGDADMYRPDSVVLRLMGNGREVEHHSLNTSDKTVDEFEMIFTQQKRYSFGVPIHYTVKQNSIDHYNTKTSGSLDTGFIVNNEHSLDKTSVSITAHWLDAMDQDGKRPESLIIHLYADGEDSGKTIELSENNSWNDSFIDLDIHKVGGGEIEYTVEAEHFEHESDYIFTSYGDSHVGYDFVYEHTPETVSLEGVVLWDDGHDQDGVRPSVVNLYVRQAGGTVRSFKAEAGAESDEWGWIIEGLPAYMPGKQGELLKYNIEAANITGYDTPLVESDDAGWIIQYHRDPQTISVKGCVNWDDDDDRDRIRPDSVYVMLWRDGRAYMGTREAQAGDGWTYSFDKVPRYEGAGDERCEIQYSVTGSTVEDYDWSAEGFDLTYVHDPKKTSVQVTQIWNDGDDADGLRLDEVGVLLYANGKSTGKSLTLSADSSWMGEFDSMPEYEQGKPIVYTVEIESSAAEKLLANGYSIEYVEYGEDDWSILAERTPDTIALHGTIVWDDTDDADGLRPENVIVHVKGSDEREELVVVTPGEDGEWTWELTDLPKRKGGKEIDYVVSVEEIKNYTTTVTGNQNDGYTITNKLADYSYSFTEGDGSSWVRGSNKTLDFTVKRSRSDSSTFSRFKGIQIDGKDVPKNAYEASAGSLILNLKPDYLEKLGDGSHTIEADFDDGAAQAHFTISTTPEDNSAKSPDTGDGFNFMGLMILMIMAIGGFAGLVLRRYRNNTYY